MLLIISDRLKEARHLQKALSRVQDSAVIPLHQVAASPMVGSVIVCDIDLATATAVELFRIVVARYRRVSGSSIVCITHGEAHFSAMQSYASASIVVLPYQASQAVLIETVMHAVGAVTRDKTTPTETIRAYAGKAASALSEMFDTARRG